jgi:hypothetical protein
MALFMMLAACYGVLQLAAVGSLTRSVRVMTLLLAVAVGIYGCGFVAVVLQFVYTRSVAMVTGTPIAEVVRTASYTVDPVIEEVVKVLPMALLALNTRIRAQWGLTDYVLLGAGTGAGFGLVEGLLRFSTQARATTGNAFEGWTVRLDSVGYHVPGPFEIITSWLPAPVTAGDRYVLLGGPMTHQHAVYSAFAAFGVGLVLLGKGWQRLLGLVPFAYACADHAAFNFDVVRNDDGAWGSIASTVLAGNRLMWMYPLLLLLVAGLFDWRVIRAGKAAQTDVLLPAERGGEPGVVTLGRYAMVASPWTSLIAMRFALLRRSLMFARARLSAAGAEGLHNEVRAMRVQIEGTGDAALWRSVWTTLRQRKPSTASKPNWLRRYWPVPVSVVLVLPALLYLVVGGFPMTAGIQKLFTNRLAFNVIVPVFLAGMAMVAWQLAVNVRALPAALRAPTGEQGIQVAFRTGVAAGGVAVGGLSTLRWLQGAGPADRVISNAHILDALGILLAVGGFALTAFSLMVLAASMLGPGAGLALAGGLTEAGPAAAAAMQGLLRGILMMAAGAGGVAAGTTGSKGNGGSGDGSGSGDSGSSGDPVLTDDFGGGRGMSAEQATYQEQVTGTPPGKTYNVNGVSFDGFEKGTAGQPSTLIEAKYLQDDGRFARAYENMKAGDYSDASHLMDRAGNLLDQAKAQVRAAEGTGYRIEWRVSGETAKKALQELFSHDLAGKIDVVCVPPTF